MTPPPADDKARVFQWVLLTLFGAAFLAFCVRILFAQAGGVHDGIPWLIGALAFFLVVTAGLSKLRQIRVSKEGLSGDFYQQVARAGARLDMVEQQSDPGEDGSGDGMHRKLISLAAADPLGAMGELKKHLETNLREYAAQTAFGGDAERLKGLEANQLLDFLRSKNALEPNEESALADLIPLANEALQGKSVAPGQAQALIDVAARIDLSPTPHLPEVERLFLKYLKENVPGAAPAGVKSLLLFNTSTQKTWLVFSSVGLACILDNRPKGGAMAVRWFEPREAVRGMEISTTEHKPRTGRVHLGSHRNWLYTKALFDGPQGVVDRIRKELDAM